MIGDPKWKEHGRVELDSGVVAEYVTKLRHD